MADIPLNHLSRPQLVHLLLRIVDLLSLPSMPAPSVPLSGHQRGCPNVVPYDASLDPWNAPDEGQRDSFVTRDPGALGRSGSGNNGYGLLNPAASAFYPMVSGPPACHTSSGCSGNPRDLPRFGADRKGSKPSTTSVCAGGSAQSSLPTENALPGFGPWVMCAALLVVCVEHLAYSSVLGTPPTCVRFTKSLDKAWYRVSL